MSILDEMAYVEAGYPLMSDAQKIVVLGYAKACIAANQGAARKLAVGLRLAASDGVAMHTADAPGSADDCISSARISILK